MRKILARLTGAASLQGAEEAVKTNIFSGRHSANCRPIKEKLENTIGSAKCWTLPEVMTTSICHDLSNNVWAKKAVSQLQVVEWTYAGKLHEASGSAASSGRMDRGGLRLHWAF